MASHIATGRFVLIGPVSTTWRCLQRHQETVTDNMLSTAPAAPHGLRLADQPILTGCPDASLFDITLQGRIAVTGTTSGTGIVDFKLPVAPFEASLVLKPAGSIGFGSPRPPKMVDIALLETADADGNWGTATFQPEKVGATSVDAAIAQVAWFTTPDQAFMPASELDYSTLQKNQTATIGTTVDPSFLRVYYVSAALSTIVCARIECMGGLMFS